MRFILPDDHFFDNAGSNADGDTLAVYDVGTTTDKSAYHENALTHQTPNPLVLDGNGRLGNAFISELFKVSSSQGWTKDNCGFPTQPEGAVVSYFAGSPESFVSVGIKRYYKSATGIYQVDFFGASPANSIVFISLQDSAPGATQARWTGSTVNTFDNIGDVDVDGLNFVRIGWD